MNFSEILKFSIDLLAVFLLALGIKGLSKVRSAREANRLAAIAMTLAAVGVFVESLGDSGIPFNSWLWIIAGSILGTFLGAVVAKKVAMTAMPETVALFNGCGGMSSLLVALAVAIFPLSSPEEALNMELVEPLRELFKDEVRELGKELGIPSHFIERHPFPGPGLAIRLPGEISSEKADILRKADTIYIEEIRKAGLYNEIWQAFAVLLPVQTVGVMGDERTYDFVCALRAVTSLDGMTADYYPFEQEFLANVSTRIINEVKGINRVVYDITSKPPGTIEWE